MASSAAAASSSASNLKPCEPGESLCLGDFHVLDEIFRSAAGAVSRVILPSPIRIASDFDFFASVGNE